MAAAPSDPRAEVRSEVLQGTLDLLILKTLSLGPQHGWGISQRIQQLSCDALSVGQGSLYPALHRLQRRGAVCAEWGTSENNRRAKFYRLTRTGERALSDELSTWRFFAGAVERVLASEEAQVPLAAGGGER